MDYLINETCNVGNGANSIISMLHHFLEPRGLKETRLHLHADKCSGQNKNRYMMAYLIWRILVGLNEEITISFLLVSHTILLQTGGLVYSRDYLSELRLKPSMILLM